VEREYVRTSHPSHHYNLRVVETRETCGECKGYGETVAQTHEYIADYFSTFEVRLFVRVSLIVQLYLCFFLREREREM
jgi:hypothetical protein